MSFSKSLVRTPNSVLIGSLIAGAVLVVVAFAFVLSPGNPTKTDRDLSVQNGASGSADEPDSVPVERLTRCAEPPTLTAKSVYLGSSGLDIATRIFSGCADGDVLANSRYRVTVIDSANRDVASGIFDLARQPLAVSSDGGSATFVFPIGAYWRTPAVINGDVHLRAYSEGVDGTGAGSAAPGLSLTAVSAGAPESGNLEAAAHSALVDLAVADRLVIDAALLERWQPQLSSKRPGLAAEGIIWTTPDIIRENLEFRQRYPDAKLVWSGDWPVFSEPTWWVTLAGIPFASGDQANAWCASEGFDRDHCFAKLMSRVRGTKGTTMLQN